MSPARNRDQAASNLTKREEAALRVLAQMLAGGRPTNILVADHCVTYVDALFDALETPVELRNTEDEEHETHDWTGAPS